MCGYKLLFIFLVIFMVEGKKKPSKPHLQYYKQKPIVPSAVSKQSGKFPQIKKPISSQIIAGADISSDQVPWQAAIIVKRSTTYFFCGGSLIHPNWILSAGHCTFRSTSYDVRLGSPSPYYGGIAIFSNISFTHANYSSTNLNNDLGLIYLSQAAPISIETIAVVQIVPSSITSFTNLIVSGWGKTSDSATSIAATLQYAPVSVISNTECRYTYGSTVITSNTLCTKGNPRQATCQGDSGGPLVMNTTTPYLVGVVSFVASSGCERGLPSGYIKIANYRWWLYDITGLAF